MANSGIPGISLIPGVGLTTQTFDGLPGGMNLALPGEEIDDTQARYMQDILVDQPGLDRRRGPVQAVSTISAALARKGTGLAAALNPQGASRFAALTGTVSTGFLDIYNAALSAIISIAWPFALPGTSGSFQISDIKPALRGGAWIGTSSDVGASVSQALGLWYGGTFPNATITVTVARGSSTLTGAGFTAGVDVGMFVFANTDNPYSQAYIGIVKSVDSNTSLTLSAPSPYNVTAKSATFQSVRGFAPKVGKGHLTTDVSAATVTGGGTKFRSQKLDAGTVLTGTTVSTQFTITAIGGAGTAGLTPGMPVTGTGIATGAVISTVDSGTQVTLTIANTGSGTNSFTFKVPWDLYRASDGTWIGTVLSVQSEVGLTLLANAGISLADEAFIALRADANFSLVTTGTSQKVGFISANYGDRQWYFNNGQDFAFTSRGWFSDPSDPEIVDMSIFDGDWIDIVSTSNVNEPIRGAQSAYNGLLTFKETETFIITGSSPASFGVRKLVDDGAVSGGSIQAYAGGVMWAGREGIWLYDGINTTNLTATILGTYWNDTVRTLDPTKYRMWSMIDRDHYFLFLENVTPTHAVVKGNVSTTPTKYTISINLITRAVTTHVNLDIRGSIAVPGTAGKTVWYLVNDSTIGHICDGDALFTQQGLDQIICDGSAQAGPDFYIESKKYDAGDGLRLKRFKQLAIWYLAQGDAMLVDTVLGLNDIGQTLTGNFPASGFTWDTLRAIITTWNNLKAQFATWNAIVQSVFVPARVRFQKRNQYMSFRLYQASANVTRIQTGPFQIAYKLSRPGRI